jgi:CubicO group peptidase (beta-lactamase class C family)
LVEENIRDVIEVCGASSLSYGILYEDGEVATRSYGYRDQEDRKPANENTIYAIASISKAFLSAAAGILVAEEKIDWRKPLKTYIPEFNPINDTNIGQYANLIDVLCHATGLARHDLLHVGPFRRCISQKENIVHVINNLPAKAGDEPRFRCWWLYNNYVTTLAAIVIENAMSHTPYAQFLQTRILTPLGLSRTLLTQEKLLSDRNIALPYACQEDGSFYKLDMPDNVETNNGFSSMGAWSSVRDMLSFAKSVLDSEETEKLVLAGGIASLETNNPLKEMNTIRSGFHPIPSGDNSGNAAGYGLGWLRVTTPSVHIGALSSNHHACDSAAGVPYILGQESPELDVVLHNGKLCGFNSVLMTFPETKTAIVVLSNGAVDGDPADWCARILLQQLFDLHPRVNIGLLAREEARLCKEWFRISMMVEEVEEQNTETSRRSLDHYTGRYVNSSLCIAISVRLGSGGLQIHFNDREDAQVPLRHIQADKFTFMPKTRDEWLRKSMDDYFRMEMTVLDFESRASTHVSGLFWKWSATEDASWLAKEGTST